MNQDEKSEHYKQFIEIESINHSNKGEAKLL